MTTMPLLHSRPNGELPPTVIHETAVVDALTEIGQGCVIDAYAVIHPGVKMGNRNRVGSFSVIGGDPQSREYEAATGVRLGDDNVIGCHVTIDSGTLDGGTQIGDDVRVMHYGHIAHDCTIGSHVTMANSVQLAGHVSVGEHSKLYGETVAQQWVRIGEKVMTSARSGILHDIPPYCIAAGMEAARLIGVNEYLLKKLGSPTEEIEAVRSAFHALFFRHEPLEQVESLSPPSLRPLFDFLRAKSKHGIMARRRKHSERNGS